MPIAAWCFSNCSLRRNTLAVIEVTAYLNHRAGEVQEVPAYEKAGQHHREGRAEASHDQDNIFCLLEHGRLKRPAEMKRSKNLEKTNIPLTRGPEKEGKGYQATARTTSEGSEGFSQ